ncbi:MAG: hypothetical protein N3A64_05445 [Desulfobacterota bacterium]|nr:hypothetical protein [Thermodesulfobacteriota bacterium]
MREVKIGDWLKEGYEAVKTELTKYILPMLIILGVSLTVVGVVFLGPLFCGFYYIIFQRMKGKSATTGDLFRGFDMLWDALLGWIVILVVTFGVSLIPFLGFILSLLSGAPFIFVLPLIVEQRIPFIDAIKESLLLFREKWLDLIPFYVIALLVGISGVIIFGVGILFTFPIYLYATACLYRDWIGLRS